MQIILVNKVENLGNLGDVINVKSGYARNFLIPNGKAVIATPSNIKLILKKKIELEQKLLDKLSLAESRAKKIRMITQPVTIFLKSRKEGKLFGSVGSRDISELLSNLSGIEVKKREIHLLNGALRTIGKHNIIFKPHHTIIVNIIVNIVSKEE
ncbi:MAG: 50S ribosomal protein L9 [Buchnera aphidicola (Floraphis choui)]